MPLDRRAVAAFLLFVVGLVFIGVFLSGTTAGVPEIAGPNIRAEFLIFVITLLGVALLHHHTLHVALVGLAATLCLKFGFDDHFHFVEHINHEWKILINLFGLLIGFGVLAKHFEDTNIPALIPRYLPNDWRGGFMLLLFVFILSSFLDNIAAAMIGGTIAKEVYKDRNTGISRVYIGYLAAIVAASNAGGSGSVVGDTTTTMMWIAGVPAVEVLCAYVAAIPAFACFAVVCSIKQQAFWPIQKDEVNHHQVDLGRLAVVALILIGAIVANVVLDFPAVGVWLAILIGWGFYKMPWEEIRHGLGNSIFLLALVTCASLMPVDQLPKPSVLTTFNLGLISSVFDNIPLTKLALDQGGYIAALLAFAVGFGGSITWFGSSAGVALANLFPQGKSVIAWVYHGWPIVIGYVVGFWTLHLFLTILNHVV